MGNATISGGRAENPFLVQAIDEAIDADTAAGIGHIRLMIAEPMWQGFKGSLHRTEYRQRVGTRFINAYRGIPISIHDEWEWGWNLQRENDDYPEVTS